MDLPTMNPYMIYGAGALLLSLLVLLRKKLKTLVYDTKKKVSVATFKPSRKLGHLILGKNTYSNWIIKRNQRKYKRRMRKANRIEGKYKNRVKTTLTGQRLRLLDTNVGGYKQAHNAAYQYMRSPNDDIKVERDGAIYSVYRIEGKKKRGKR